MTRRHPRRQVRRRDDRGTALVELVWLGILLLVPLVWIVVSVMQVQSGAFGVSTAARSAARAAARQALTDQGHPDLDVAVDVSCTRSPCHSGTSVITVRVTSRVPLPLMPAFFGDQPPGVDVDASHTVPIGQYQETGDDHALP